jgi:hypothetical protein
MSSPRHTFRILGGVALFFIILFGLRVGFNVPVFQSWKYFGALAAVGIASWCVVFQTQFTGIKATIFVQLSLIVILGVLFSALWYHWRREEILYVAITYAPATALVSLVSSIWGAFASARIKNAVGIRSLSCVLAFVASWPLLFMIVSVLGPIFGTEFWWMKSSPGP